MPATRFQCGTSYVASLIRIRPQDDARIRDATLAVLAELDGPDRLHQRTNARVERLERELAKWNADGSKTATIAAVQARMQQVCSTIPDAESAAKAACVGFLSAGGSLDPSQPFERLSLLLARRPALRVRSPFRRQAVPPLKRVPACIE